MNGYFGENSDIEHSSDEENVIDEYEKIDSFKNLWTYEVLDCDKVFTLMNYDIKQVTDVLTILPTFGRVLLNHFKWDKEKLLESYFENENEILKAANIPLSISDKKEIDTNEQKDCEICFSTFIIKDMMFLECYHCFCRECYKSYLETKIVQDGVADTISCIKPKCNYIVSDEVIIELIKTDNKLRTKYMYLITKSFVQNNRLMKWCPSPNCDYAIKVIYCESRSVKCNCGYTFCFSCSDMDHDPLKCDLLNKWKSVNIEEAETLKWLNSNTQKCPNCKARIEKNGGCNHMTCKSCKYEFCWICLGTYSSHSPNSNSCNAFKIKQNSEDFSSNERYSHYYQRYTNHKNSLELEKKMDVNGSYLIEAEHIKKAVDILCQCRLTLMNTYVFAFYLKQNNNSLIFEDNQRDLEIATEILSRYLEHDVINADLKFPNNMKQEIQDKYKYCERRRNVLLNYVYEGYRLKWWYLNSTNKIY